MFKSHRFVVAAVLLGAYLLSACSGAMPRQNDPLAPGSSASQVTEVVFTGTVQSMGSGDWTISGQTVGVNGSTAVDANIQVGDNVKVEAQVSQDGKVFALKIESSLPGDAAANANDGNANDVNGNTNDNTNSDNSNANANANANINDNSVPTGPEQEILGAVKAITNDTITVDDVTYRLASFTEFKTPIVVGDQVKIHVIVNSDGSLTIREIEKTTGTGVTTNNNGSDDNGNTSNSNDDDNNNSSNSNDDNGGSSNSNNDNGSGGGNGNG